MLRRALIASGFLAVGACVVAAYRGERRATALIPGALNARTYVDGGVDYRYQLFVPKDFDPAKRWPVIVALHGSREKGTDGMKQTLNGLAPVVLEQASRFPAVVVFPQVHPGEPPSRIVSVLDGLVTSAMHDVNGDPQRLYLTGLSFGGLIAYDLVLHLPGRFAAFVPISAQPIVPASDGVTREPEPVVDAALVRALHNTPTWVFHGARDANVPVDRVRRLVPALRAGGVPVAYTEYADGSHESWDRTYRSPGLWTWLLAQHR